MEKTGKLLRLTEFPLARDPPPLPTFLRFTSDRGEIGRRDALNSLSAFRRSRIAVSHSTA